jgi:hypothetical protein
MEILNIDINELKDNPKNPRKITKSDLNKLIRSIKEFGFVDPIIANKHKGRENIVVGGHQRLRAAKAMKMKEVPVTYVDLPEDKENLLNVALNEISGTWDDEKLFELLSQLNEKGVDLTLTGFDEPFIDEIMSANADHEKEAMIDVVPQAPEQPKSRPGDLFQLGNHKLLCGDSTQPETFVEIMGDIQADSIWTDPPYGVSYKGTNNPNGKDWGVMQNDDLRGDKLYQMLQAIYTNCFKHSKSNAALYSCYASVNHIIFEKALNEAGFSIKQQLIWEKVTF